MVAVMVSGWWGEPADSCLVCNVVSLDFRGGIFIERKDGAAVRIKIALQNSRATFFLGVRVHHGVQNGGVVGVQEENADSGSFTSDTPSPGLYPGTRVGAYHGC
eukprot:3932951-Rhodomonas_salina.1